MSCDYSLLLHFNELISDTAPVDSSDTGITCTYVNAEARSIAPAHFVRRTSCYFNSGTSHVTVANDAAIQLSGSFTIDFWVRFDDAEADSILFNSATDGINLSFKLELKQIASVSFLILTSINSSGSIGSRYYLQTFTEDAWYHVAVTRDGSGNIRVFINGDLKQGGDTGGPYTNNTWGVTTTYTQTTGMKIGVDGTGASGYVDEFRIVKGEAKWISDFTVDHPVDPYCVVYGCTDPDAFNYSPLADKNNSLCIPATYWNKPDLGVIFKANALDTAGDSTHINIQGIQKDTWTQVDFRSEGFDTAGQYFPSISTFKPTVAGKYNLRAQIQVQDVLGYAPSGTDEHRIMAAIHHNGVAIEQNITSVEHYYPDDPKEDTTVVVETVVELTEQDIIDGSNEFTAYVYIKGVREYEIDDKYNLCAETIGCTDPVADNTDSSAPPTGMVIVSPGNFLYGPPTGNDNWNSTQTAAAFAIDINEVTAGEYKACVDAPGNPCSYNGGTSSDYTYDNNKDNHPINYVTHAEALDYCIWKGKRLPTEIEWEKAARGTDGRIYPWGDDTADCNYAVMNACAPLSTSEVGQKPNGVSPYGVHDMAGNVFEWTSSFYSSNQGDRVSRGGAYSSSAPALISSTRTSSNPGGRSPILGFRCVQGAIVGVDDGSCYYEPGCANPDYKEYWDLVNAGTVIDFPDDSLCLTKVVFGCMTATATNYNEDANYDDGSCMIPGCTNPNASNYDTNANVDDGSCTGVPT